MKPTTLALALHANTTVRPAFRFVEKATHASALQMELQPGLGQKSQSTRKAVVIR